jgi:hypothetical protein
VTGALVGDGVTGALVGDGVTGALVGDGVTGALVTPNLVGDGVIGALVGVGVTGALVGALVGELVVIPKVELVMPLITAVMTPSELTWMVSLRVPLLTIKSNPASVLLNKSCPH